jgi:peptide deformylase
MARKTTIFLLFFFIARFGFSEEFSMTNFTPPGDPSLQGIASEVIPTEIQSKEIQSIIDRMFFIAQGQRTDPNQRAMVGLAAPQIGISKRIILVDIGVDTEKRELGELTAFINPEIIWASDEIVNGHEGCFSVDSRVLGIVPRSESIKIRAYDRQGNQIIAEYSGYTARIFQHETDHLDGIRFPDRVGPNGKLDWVEKGRHAEYRIKWQNWDYPCPWELWLAMKAGKPFLPPAQTDTESETRS